MKRGCGERTKGGLYACSGTSPWWGKPVEHFLVDPPVPLDTKPFRAPQLFQRDGLNHILVYIGAQHYPYVPDFVEEARGMGVSRRIPNNFPIDKLSHGSCMYLCHSRAILAEFEEVRRQARIRDIQCGKHILRHESLDEFCLWLLYWLAGKDGEGIRQIGDTTYSTPVPPGGRPKDIAYLTGLFAVFPITNLDYIVGERKEVPKELAEKASKTTVPLRAVQE